MRPQRDGRAPAGRVLGFRSDHGPVLVTCLYWWGITPTMAVAATALWLVGQHAMAVVVAAVYGPVMLTGAWITTPRATTRHTPAPSPTPVSRPVDARPVVDEVPVLVTVVPDPPALPASPATLTDTLYAAHHRYTHGRTPS